eukprot:scaffold104964_cov56-Cyclotella_meneghiniana.AAC.1
MVMVEESDRRVFVSSREALKCVGDFKRISLSTLVLCVLIGVEEGQTINNKIINAESSHRSKLAWRSGNASHL